MIRILANDGIHPDGKMLLEEANYEVHTEKVPQEKLHEVLPDYDVIIVRSATKVRKDLIDQCPRLKIIARGGVGLDNIDADHARSQGIKVMNTPDASSLAVAELSFAHIFSLARFLHQSNRQVPAIGNTEFKNLKKTYSKGVQVRGKTLGVIGFGRIGQETARIGLALGMNVMPVDLKVNQLDIGINVFKTEDVRLSVRLNTYSLDEVLSKSDFISLHVPYTGDYVIGEAEFDKMKDGVFFVNCSRGGTVDESALIKALNEGKIAGAGIDVYENEPSPRIDLLQHENVSVSPHIGASTLEAQRNIGLELADKILAFFGDDK
jgi:D-3-phosphoglycerate dehydrogenase